MIDIETLIAKGFYIELVPIVVLGLFAGLAKFFQLDEDSTKKATLRVLFGFSLSSMVVCTIIYAALDSTALTYLTKFAIAGLVAFFGIDKALDIAQRLLSLRNSDSNHTHKEHKDD